MCIWGQVLAPLYHSASLSHWSCYHGMSNLYRNFCSNRRFTTFCTGNLLLTTTHPANQAKIRGNEWNRGFHIPRNPEKKKKRVNKRRPQMLCKHQYQLQWWTIKPTSLNAAMALITWCSRAQGKEFASYSKSVGNGRKFHPRAASR